MKKILLVFIFVTTVWSEQNLSANLQHNATDIKPPQLNMAEVNKTVIYRDFHEMIIKFPSDIKALESITFRYVDNDGHMHEKLLNAGVLINWNSDFIFQQKSQPAISKILDVSVTSMDPNLKKHSETNKTIIAPKIDLPLKIVKFDDDLRLNIKRNRVEILCKEELFRSFKFDDLHKIALDFNRSSLKSDDNSTTITLNLGGFDSLAFEPHDGFYRLLIKADGGSLDTNKTQDGYSVIRN